MSTQQRCNSCGDGLQLFSPCNYIGSVHENASYTAPVFHQGHLSQYLQSSTSNTIPHLNVYNNQLQQPCFSTDFQSPSYFHTYPQQNAGNYLPITNLNYIPRRLQETHPEMVGRRSLSTNAEQYQLPADFNASAPCITLSFCCLSGCHRPTVDAPVHPASNFQQNSSPHEPVTRRWNGKWCSPETNSHCSIPHPAGQDNRSRRNIIYRNHDSRMTPQNAVFENIKHRSCYAENNANICPPMPELSRGSYTYPTGKMLSKNTLNEVKKAPDEIESLSSDLPCDDTISTSVVTHNTIPDSVSTSTDTASTGGPLKEEAAEFGTVQELQAEFDQIMDSFKKSCTIHCTFTNEHTESKKKQTKIFEALCELTEEYCQRLRGKWNVLINKMEHASLEEEKVKKIVHDLKEKLASQKRLINSVLNSNFGSPDASGDSSNVRNVNSLSRPLPIDSKSETVTTKLSADGGVCTENEIQILQPDIPVINTHLPPSEQPIPRINAKQTSTAADKKGEINSDNFLPLFIPPQVELKHPKYVSQMYAKQRPQCVKEERKQRSRVFYSNYHPELKYQQCKPKEYVPQNTETRYKSWNHNNSKQSVRYVKNNENVSLANYKNYSTPYFEKFPYQSQHYVSSAINQTSLPQQPLSFEISNTLSVSYSSTGRWSWYVSNLCSQGGCNIERLGALARAKHPSLFCLGKSRFGVVELALDLTNKVPVAVKHVNVSTSVLLTLLAPMLTIGSAEAPPHLAKYLALLVDSKCPSSSLVALTLCEWNLSEYMDHIQGFLPPGDLQASFMRIIAEMLEGLKFLHSLKPIICHGNLKPTNILVDKEQRVRLADYGVMHELYKMRQVSSNEAMWWSRETLEGLNSSGLFPMSPASDVQSAGMIIHYVLAKKTHPFGFNQATPLDIVNNIITRRWTLSPELSIDVCSFLRDMLDGDPYKRPTAHAALSEVWIWDNSRRWCF